MSIISPAVFEGATARLENAATAKENADAEASTADVSFVRESARAASQLTRCKTNAAMQLIRLSEGAAEFLKQDLEYLQVR